MGFRVGKAAVDGCTLKQPWSCNSQDAVGGLSESTAGTSNLRELRIDLLWGPRYVESLYATGLYPRVNE